MMTMLPQSFEWIIIPEGQVILKPSKYVHDYIKTDTTFTVPTFRISKMPITNAQYAKFIEIGGYDNRQWWSEAGWQAKIDGWDDIFVAELERESSLHWMPTGIAWSCPRFWYDKRFNGDNQPVVGISWHEAMAFCSWLHNITDEMITLPTDQQWELIPMRDDGLWYWCLTNWDTGDTDPISEATRILRGGVNHSLRYGNWATARNQDIGFFIISSG